MKRAPRPPAPTILYEDAHLLAIDKPSGLIFGRGNADARGLPESAITAGLTAADEPFLLVHRFDPAISGVVLYARDADTQAALTAAFEANQVAQKFVALVRGFVAEDGEINLNIYFDKRTHRLEASERRGQPCVTRFRILERVVGNTWIECQPLQGRADQIRIHLAAIEHPLAIDPVHGSVAPIMLSQYKRGYRTSSRHEELPLLNRMTMHARSLEFAHPHTGAAIHVEAPLPKDLRVALRQLKLLA